MKIRNIFLKLRLLRKMLNEYEAHKRNLHEEIGLLKKENELCRALIGSAEKRIEDVIQCSVTEFATKQATLELQDYVRRELMGLAKTIEEEKQTTIERFEYGENMFHEKHEMIMQLVRDCTELKAQSITHQELAENTRRELMGLVKIIEEEKQAAIERFLYEETMFHEKHEMIMQLTQDYTKFKSQSMGLFHEKHEMIMREHQEILELVRVNLLRYYENRQMSDDEEEVVTHVKTHPISMYPYEFAVSYEHLPVEVFQAEEHFFVYHHGEKLYFPKEYTRERVVSYYRFLLSEQDEKSPHRYMEKGEGIPTGGCFVDVGAAEGFLGLEHIRGLAKLILIEPDEQWVEALQLTFSPYRDRTEILFQYAGTNTAEGVIALCDLDCISTADYIKIDVEGQEMQVLEGLDVSKLKSGCKVAVCAYHNQGDERLLNQYFSEHGMRYQRNRGYLLSTWGGYAEPYLRTGVIRAIKE